MYTWEQELNREAKREQKRWNGAVITTSKQWTANADGACAPMNTSYDKIWNAIKDYRNSREWG